MKLHQAIYIHTKAGLWGPESLAATMWGDMKPLARKTIGVPLIIFVHLFFLSMLLTAVAISPVLVPLHYLDKWLEPKWIKLKALFFHE